jgi:hypothetical protein
MFDCELDALGDAPSLCPDGMQAPSSGSTRCTAINTGIRAASP